MHEGYDLIGSGTFEPLSPRETLEELEMFLSYIDDSDKGVQRIIFRSDHASNYFVLKGRLREKTRLMQEIRCALDDPDESSHLRPEWMRGL